MDLSPADPNIIYFKAYPTWVSTGEGMPLDFSYPNTGVKAQITRAEAALILASGQAIDVVEITGVTETEVLIGYSNPNHFYEFWMSSPIYGFTPYALGGDWYPPDIGGSSARLFEITTTDAAAFLADGGIVGTDADWSDGEQTFVIGTLAGTVPSSFAGAKVWDFPPGMGDFTPPQEFWTGFLGAIEIA